MTAREIAILIVQPITDRLAFEIAERAARAGALTERREIVKLMRARRDECPCTSSAGSDMPYEPRLTSNTFGIVGEVETPHRPRDANQAQCGGCAELARVIGLLEARPSP